MAHPVARPDPVTALLRQGLRWDMGRRWNEIQTGIRVLREQNEGVISPTQTSTGAQPAVTADYADFDGTDDELGFVATPLPHFLLSDDFGWQAGGGATFYVVCAPDSDGAGVGPIFHNNQGDICRTINESGGALQFYLQTQWQTTDGEVRTTGTFAVGTAHILFIRHNKWLDGGNPNQKWNVNGPANLTIANGGLTEIAANAGGVRGNNNDTFYIGGQRFGAGNYDGKIFTIGWLPGQIGDDQVNLLGTYFARRYSQYGAVWR